MSEKKGWELLHSQLPKAALKAIPKDAYGVEGLTDVNEGYLITRLFASELPWSWEILRQEYLGHEDRQARGKDYTTRWYLAAVHGRLTVGGQIFDGSGAHDNRKIDAAFKGAATVAFKNATKTAGLFMQLLMDGRAIDFVYQTRDGEVAQGQQPDQSSEQEEVGAQPVAEGSGADSEAIKVEAEPPAAPPPAPDDSKERKELYAISQKLGRDRASIDGLLAIYPVEKVLAKARKELAEKEDRDPQLLGELTTGHAANA